MIDKSLETARKVAKMTQDELAEKAGIPRSTIAMIEAGTREINAGQIKKIASVLGIAPCRLLSVNPGGEFKCEKTNLGFSDSTIKEIQNMDDEVRLAFEYLINDPTFGLAIASYFFPAKDEGIHLNGKSVAASRDEVTIGSYSQYSAHWKVDDLYEYVMERDIQATLADIRRRIRR